MVSAFIAAAALVGSSPSTCPATTVRYESVSPARLGDLPWVSARLDGAAGIVFLPGYLESLRDRRVNRSDGLVLWRRGTQIVWSISATSTTAALTARRLDGRGSVRLAFVAGSDGFALAPTFPSTGCWRLTVRTEAMTAVIVARVVARPRRLQCDATPVGAPPLARPRSAGIGNGWGAWRTPENGALIYTHGRGPDGSYMKVPWWVVRNCGDSLELAGFRLDAPGSFRQEFSRAREHDGPQDQAVFPSTVDVPSAGCWLFRLRTGLVAGVLVVRAVDAPAKIAR